MFSKSFVLECVKMRIYGGNGYFMYVFVLFAGTEVRESGSLFIKRTSRSDQGVYICIAQNSAGTAFGQIRLQILGKANS